MTDYRKGSDYRKTQPYRGPDAVPAGGARIFTDPGFVGYRVVLAELGTAGLGTPLVDDVFTATGVPEQGPQLRWTDELNAAGSCEFTLPLDSPALLTADFAIGEREIHVYREDAASERLVWGGRLWIADVQAWFVRFVAYGWYFDLTRRNVAQDTAVTEDQFRTVRRLVDYTQGRTDGNLGLGHYDLSDSGITRTTVACDEERKKISDMIEELASADDGFDFVVYPDKRLRLFSPRRGTTPGVTFDGATNVAEFRYQSDATELSTEVAAVGPQEQCAVPSIATAVDVAARAQFKLLEETLSSDSTDAAFLQGLADEELRVSKVPRFQPSITVPTQLASTPNFFAYDVGDVVTVQSSRGPAGGFGQFNRTFRILSRTVSVTNPGVETVELGLDAVV